METQAPVIVVKNRVRNPWGVALAAFFVSAVWAPAQQGSVTEQSAKYVFRSGDRVQYRIAEDPIKGKDPIIVAVNGVGEASFPISRESDIRLTLQVRGKTLDQVKDELSQRLLADYYNKATIELALADKQLTPGRVQFFGELRGTIPLAPDSPPLMLSDAVLQLGTPDFADLKRVKVHRVDPVTQQSKEITVDVRSILKDGQRDRDIVLLDGDRVEVPQKWIN
ncbi:MAG: hypothetical protein IT581_05375 [Verrucomicrobiales bacterium]|nr:hypothetical protein [Verrucomicrobiales bacterium]